MSKLPPMPHRCAESTWEPEDLTPRCRNNGPETMDSIARGVILTVLVGTLVGLGLWLCSEFSQAETAIIHATGGK